MIFPQPMIEDIKSHLQQCKFRELCDKYFAPNFFWEIKGTSILSGMYYDKDKFFQTVIDRLNRLLLPGWKMHILNVHIAEKSIIVEMQGEVKRKAGGDYNNAYCWIFNFDPATGKVVNLTAYYDSLLVNETLQQGERL